MRDFVRVDTIEQALREVSRTHSSVTIKTISEEVANLIGGLFPWKNVLHSNTTKPDLYWEEGIFRTPAQYRLVITEFDDSQLGKIFDSLLWYVTPIFVGTEEELSIVKCKLFPEYTEEEYESMREESARQILDYFFGNNKTKLQEVSYVK